MKMRLIRIALTLITGAALAGGVALPAAKDVRVLRADEAAQQQAHEKWVFERLKEAQSIKVGNTYADVRKHFRGDGGLSPVTQHRFVMILCSCIKIDVEFTDKDGRKIGFPIPADARVSRISKLYLEQPFSD